MKAPYGWIWTRGGYRKLTPKGFNRRLRRAHNRRLSSKSTKPQEKPPHDPATEDRP